MKMEFALLDLLNDEKTLVKQLNELEYDIQFRKKRAEELESRNTLCDTQAALDDRKKVKNMLEDQVHILGKLKEVRVRIRNYLREMLIK
jgi:hypothetical protein